MPLQFSQTGRVEDIMNGLRLLQKRDDYVEEQVRVCGKKAGKWGWGLFACFLLGVLGVFGAAALMGSSSPFMTYSVSFAVWWGLVVIAGIVCLVGVIYWLAQRSKWAHQDMEDRRIALALRFLEVLGRDVPKKAKCAVDINFDGYMKHGQLVEQQGGGWFNPVRNLKYVDTWFTARGSLADGNRFRVTVEQVVRRKEKRKRKYTKVRERTVEEVTLTLKISPASYPNWQQLTQTLRTGRMDNIHVTRAQVQDGVARVVGETAMHMRNVGRYGEQTSGDQNLAGGDTLLRLFLYVYGELQQCRGNEP